jgi:hypothetical protein
MSFSLQKGLLQTDILLSLVIWPVGCCHTIPQGKKPDVEVLGWRGYTWCAFVRPVGRTAKFSKTMLEATFGREMNILWQQLRWTFLLSACQLQALSKHETSVALFYNVMCFVCLSFVNLSLHVYNKQ